MTKSYVYIPSKLPKSTLRIKKPVDLGWRHKTVGHVLQADALLQALKQHSLYLLQLQTLVSDVLRGLTHLDLSVQVSRYESGLLKLYVPNAATATRLRFLQQPLMTQLTAYSALANLIKIVIRVEQAVSPAPSAFAPSHQSTLTHLDSSVNLVGSVQVTLVSEDQKLRDSWQRLARHTSI